MEGLLYTHFIYTSSRFPHLQGKGIHPVQSRELGLNLDLPALPYPLPPPCSRVSAD